MGSESCQEGAERGQVPVDTGGLAEGLGKARGSASMTAAVRDDETHQRLLPPKVIEIDCDLLENIYKSTRVATLGNQLYHDHAP